MLTPGHLWFLVVLTQCVLITAGVRLIGHRVLGPERASGFTARLGRILSGPFALPLAAIPYAAGIILQGFATGGLTEPRTVLGSVSALTAYLGGFWFGWAIHATRGEGKAGLLRLARAWWAYLIAAVVLTPVALAVTEPLWLSAAIQGLVGWMWVIGLMGLCVRHLKRERGWVRYLADASYWMYIIHLPVLGAVAVPLLHLPWPAELKLLVVLLVSVPLLLASYELLVRHTWLGGWLNGRKHPRTKRS
ncbi:acyltransferase family protein [Parenemella sanctibonifatiensis]|uniref:Acyltransferase 3 domain-containing protein n=1 Tax=Parenemella sanctibonifatiensis TaxID=2016505 RepID=A0A255EIE8_9ACTN|nr:acyltransferase family protein [Parenemella sanctibonifatiensis]OYN89385.1 hypothetical protein CGZ91_10810 [Parenemella sanctibonifatiensis]